MCKREGKNVPFTFPCGATIDSDTKYGLFKLWIVVITMLVLTPGSFWCCMHVTHTNTQEKKTINENYKSDTRARTLTLV